MDWLDAFLTHYHYWGILLALLACGFGLPIPEDIILITGGLLADGRPGAFALTVAVSMVGVLGGDSIVFSLGHRYRDRILRAPPFRWIVTPKRMKQIRTLYRKYGYWAIFLSRFLAGLRVPSFLMAGMSQVRYRDFMLADGAAALISVPFFVWLGYFFAEDIEAVFEEIDKAKDGLLWMVGAVAALLFLRYVVWNPVRAWWLRRSKAEAQEPPRP